MYREMPATHQGIMFPPVKNSRAPFTNLAKYKPTPTKRTA